uniref:Uncharacterized protein n=1 Tax=Anguilla anguilla TaxID=7936 RepID=A0A0E9RVA2_ANGAN
MNNCNKMSIVPYRTCIL